MKTAQVITSRRSAQVTIKENGKMVRIGKMDTLANCRQLATILQAKGYITAISY